MNALNYIEMLNRFYELLQSSEVSNNAQLLYHTLLMIDNKCSWSDWFQRTNYSLTGMMSISESALIRARNELKQLGLIDFVSSKKRGTCTKYHLLNPTKQCTKDGTKEVQKEYKRSTKEVQNADIIKPKLKTETKTKKGNTNVLPEKYVPDEALNHAIVEFIEFRKKIKKPMTDRAVKLLIKTLNGLSPDVDTQIAIIDQSIFNNWQGVFPLKEGNSKSSGNGFYDDMKGWVDKHGG